MSLSLDVASAMSTLVTILIAAKNGRITSDLRINHSLQRSLSTATIATITEVIIDIGPGLGRDLDPGPDPGPDPEGIAGVTAEARAAQGVGLPEGPGRHLWKRVPKKVFQVVARIALTAWKP